MDVEQQLLSIAHARMRRKVITVSILITFLAGSGIGSAAPIFYIYTGIGSGMLGSNSFAEAPFTINCVADTSQITISGGDFFEVNNITATVSVAGVGTGTFTIPTVNFDTQNLSTVGFSYSPFADILDVRSPIFAGYDLSTPIGPVTGLPGVNRGNQYPTTAGLFQLSSVSSVSFEAVPEPSTIALGGLCC